MKNICIILVLSLSVILNISYSQGTTGLKGEEVKPYIFNMQDLPSFGDIYLGGEIKRIFNNAKPPYEPPYPAPDEKDIPHFTYDRSAENPSLLAPNPGISFEGISQSGYIPSEPEPAVGPDNVFVIGNVTVKITDKNGNTQSSVLQSAFFNIPSAEGPGFDSKCFYDYRRGRFLALCETKNSTQNFYYLAISATSNAMSTWYIYKFDMTKNGETQSTDWSDYPGLGISDDKIVMSGQQFSFVGNQFQYQKLRVIDRAIAYTGNTLSYVDFFNWPGQQFTTKPGRNTSPGNDIYLLATKWNGGTTAELRKITGTPSSPVLSSATFISVSSYGVPPDAPGGSSAITVATGDSRTPDFFIRNGVLNIAFGIGINIGGTNVSAIKYLQISVNPLSTIPLTDETYGAANTYYFYPMVCVDNSGTMFMGFGKSGVNEFPSSYITGKRRTDASIQSSILTKSGLAVTSQSRWGDYTGIDMDESASGPGISYAWYSGQYCKASNTFGTWVTQFSFTYGQISGQVINDADGDVATTGDRTPVTGATVTLKQGTVTLNTLPTDASGNYNFGYLETAANYSVVFTPPAGKHSIDVITGTGGISQTKTDYKTIVVNLTDAQTSASNNYIVSDWLLSVSNGNWDNTGTWMDNVIPVNTEKVLITPAATVTVNNNYTCQNINNKGVLQFDNVSPRSITITDNLNLANGNITLGNNNISAGSITGAGGAGYFITNGTGLLKQSITNNDVYITFPVGLAGSYNPVNIKLDIASIPDIIGVRVSAGITIPPYIPEQVIQKEWDITENVNGGSNATIQFLFGAGDFGTNFNPALNPNIYDIGHFRTTSGYEVFEGSISGPSASLYAITSSVKIPSFSPFIVGNYNSITGALPVELASFTSNINGRNLKLKWTTASEENNEGFEVQKSEDRGQVTEWKKTGFVQGKGNSNEPVNYSFEEKNLQTGKYQYRLKQMDYNGNFEYFELSGVVEVGVPEKFDLSQNYPNPFNPVTKINFDLPGSGLVSLKVYDVLGKEVATVVNEIKDAGYYTVSFDASNLASGIYFYRLSTNGLSNVKRLVVLK